MEESIQLAGLIGPILIALSISEALNLHIWEKVQATVVYLNGLLLLVAGLSIVRVHNVWVMDWTVLVTLVGWLSLLAGLYRMFVPRGQQLEKRGSTYLVLVILFGIGAVLSYYGYFV